MHGRHSNKENSHESRHHVDDNRVLVTALGASSTALGQSDEVTEQIELGLELYQEQEYGAAITELEFAISDIRELMAGRIGETFPEPPEGWSAAEVASSGGGGAAASVRRRRQHAGA